MNILFDLNHPVDVNFFKAAITELDKLGHNIIIVYCKRGKLEIIANKELAKYKPIPIGRHYKLFINKIIGQLLRDFKVIIFQRKTKIDISVCFGPSNAIASWLNRIPYLAFEDDYEYKTCFYHANLFSTRHIMPTYIPFKNNNVFNFSGFKELAYLHPKYFKPQLNELYSYGLKPYEYIFIREIDNVSLNYKQRNSFLLKIVDYLKAKNKTIILSLENNEFKESLENRCIVLKEPVKDIYSLLNFALFTISSGDTMSRESCLLGTPCIYTGRREMLMNEELIKMKCLFKEDNLDAIIDRMNYLLKHNNRKDIKENIDNKIILEWQDTTEVILNHISDFLK